MSDSKLEFTAKDFMFLVGETMNTARLYELTVFCNDMLKQRLEKAPIVYGWNDGEYWDQRPEHTEPKTHTHVAYLVAITPIKKDSYERLVEDFIVIVEASNADGLAVRLGSLLKRARELSKK